MNDLIDAVALDQIGDEIRVAEVADDERRPFRNRPAKTSRQIVEHHGRTFAGVEQFENRMTADIAGAARNQNRHAATFLSYLRLM